MKIHYKLTNAAKASTIQFHPSKAHKSDAGWDLKACIPEPIKIFPDEIVKIPTGVCIWLGDCDGDIIELAGLYLPRSGTKGLQLANTVGLLDSSYQHESFCKLINKSDEVQIINPGDRMAQLVIIPILSLGMNLVEEFSKETGRGKGDGSSGK